MLFLCVILICYFLYIFDKNFMFGVVSAIWNDATSLPF